MQVDELLRLAVEKGASDLHLRVPGPPVLRIDGNGTLIYANQSSRSLLEVLKAPLDKKCRSSGGTWSGKSSLLGKAGMWKPRWDPRYLP